MKVFYDSNVVLDVLLNRTDFLPDSLAALKYSERKAVRGFISVVSITDIFYLVNRNLHDSAKTLEKIRTLLQIVDVAKASRKTVRNAMQTGWKDFEDAVQYSVALSIRAKYIVTRNVKDFKNSKIAVVPPSEFLELAKGF